MNFDLLQRVVKLRLSSNLERWYNSTNAKHIGILYLIFALFLGLLGTAFSVLIIRLELFGHGIQSFADYELYDSIISAHTIFMVFFMVMPAMIGGFGNFLLPLKLGCPDMAFPLLNNINKLLLIPSLALFLFSRVIVNGDWIEWTLIFVMFIGFVYFVEKGVKNKVKQISSSPVLSFYQVKLTNSFSANLTLVRSVWSYLGLLSFELQLGLWAKMATKTFFYLKTAFLILYCLYPIASIFDIGGIHGNPIILCMAGSEDLDMVDAPINVPENNSGQAGSNSGQAGPESRTGPRISVSSMLNHPSDSVQGGSSISVSSMLNHPSDSVQGGSSISSNPAQAGPSISSSSAQAGPSIPSNPTRTVPNSFTIYIYDPDRPNDKTYITFPNEGSYDSAGFGR